MKQMITAISLPGIAVPGITPQKNQRMIRQLVLLLAFCFFVITSVAQPQGSIPDPNNTYGPGSRMRTTQSTNPDSFIPETKTEFFDGKGVLREEEIKTKDLDGNDVKITKKYDERGILKTRDELRRDDIGVVYDEHLEYDDLGKIIKGKKSIWERAKWHIFKYDPQTQGYMQVSNNYVKPGTKDQCNCSKTELKLGYSYMRTANVGILGTLPTGAEISIGRRLNSHLGLILDVSGHQSSRNIQTLSRLNLQAGIKYNIRKCDDDDNISVFTRIAIGLTMENLKTKVQTVSATAPGGTAGVGADVKISGQMSVYISADWAPSYFNKTLQSNFQAGAGLAIKFGSR